MGVLVGDRVIEARRGGVVSTHIKKFKKRGKCEFFEYNVKNEALAIKYLLNQIGKPYKYFNNPFNYTPWHSDKNWRCSELVAATTFAGGSPIVQSELKWVSPRDLWVNPMIKRCN